MLKIFLQNNKFNINSKIFAWAGIGIVLVKETRGSRKKRQAKHLGALITFILVHKFCLLTLLKRECMIIYQFYVKPPYPCPFQRPCKVHKVKFN